MSSANATLAERQHRAITDRDLVVAAQGGDERSIEILLARYQGLARSRGSSYFVRGADHEDVLQEAMIGLFKAIRDFDPTRGVSFAGFADVCIHRQIQTAVKTANRKKHDALHSYLSLDLPSPHSDSDSPLMDLLHADGKSQDPMSFALAAEQIDAIRAHLNGTLTALERRVLALMMEGVPYGEIAELVDTHRKAVDNALQRARRKLRDYLDLSNLASSENPGRRRVGPG